MPNDEAEPNELSQDEYVSRLRPDPSAPPVPTLSFDGFLGDSDREGRRRLYLTKDLDYYVEFGPDDVVEVQSVPADSRPFLGQESSRIRFNRTAHLEFTRTRSARPLDEYDLDVINRRIATGFQFRTVLCASDICHTDRGATCEGCPVSDECFTQNIECQATDDNCFSELCNPDTFGACISALCQPD